jgi:hypothetical protein
MDWVVSQVPESGTLSTSSGHAFGFAQRRLDVCGKVIPSRSLSGKAMMRKPISPGRRDCRPSYPATVDTACSRGVTFRL